MTGHEKNARIISFQMASFQFLISPSPFLDGKFFFELLFFWERIFQFFFNRGKRNDKKIGAIAKI